MPQSIHVLVPAWNEAEKLGATLDSLLKQDRPADRIIVIPNGCTDETPDIAHAYAEQHDSITVMELPRLKHRKSEALNRAWNQYSRDADIVITADADTEFKPTAFAQWEQEFLERGGRNGQPLGGSVAKAIVLGDGYWKRMQKQEYARVVDAALLRGATTVLAGAGTAFSGKALLEVVALDNREGPWSYDSMTEDYEITLQLRKMGYACVTSPNVRMYTDGMQNLSSLWGQRMKWSTGQYHELMRHGVTRYTARDWGGHVLMSFMILVQFVWMAIIGIVLTQGSLDIHWFWWTLYPAGFLAYELFLSSRMAHVGRKDYLYTLAILPYAVFRSIGVAWLMWSALVVARERLTGRFADRWELQSLAEQR